MIESHVRSVRDFIFWANNFHISAYSKYYCKLDLLFLGTFKILVLELSHQLTTTQLKKENEQIINSSPCRRINHITTRIVEWLDNITYVYTRGMYIILFYIASLLRFIITIIIHCSVERYLECVQYIVSGLIHCVYLY